MNEVPPTAAQEDQLRCNVELKARLDHLAAAREIAESLATDRLPDERQLDTYFHCRQGRLKLREIDGAPARLIAYHRPDAIAAVASRYYLIDVPDPAALRQALAATLGILLRVEKRREIYLYHNVRIHLDQVTDLGTFLEFEAVLNDTGQIQNGEAIVAQLQQRFGIGEPDLLTSSYSDMLLQQDS